MKIVYVIDEFTNKDGEKKTNWRPCGIAFDNKDGSLAVKLDLFPQVKLQIREKKEDKGY